MLHPIQALRLLSALWVVLYHAAHSPTVAPGNGLWHNFTGLGYLGVDIFFVISGYIMALNSAKRPPGLREALLFSKLRLARIYSGWWPVFILCLLVIGSAGWQSKDLLGSFWLYQLNFNVLVLPVTWTLTFELYFYGVIALGLLLPIRYRLASIGVVLLLLLACNSYWVIHERFTPENFSRTHYGLFLFASPLCLEFLLGYLLQRYQTRLQHLLPTAVLALITLASAAAVYIYAIYFAHRPSGLAGFFHYPERAILAGLWACSLLALFLRLGDWLPQKISLWGGDISYQIYLLHLPCLWLITPWTTHLPLAWRLMALLGSTLVAASAMHYFIERPIYQFIKKF